VERVGGVHASLHGRVEELVERRVVCLAHR
jgi:hypothetical protein